MILRKKLAIISDFHMDINHFSDEEKKRFLSALTDLSVTDLHFAGDLSNDFHGITAPFLKEISQLTNLSVTYNLGNHDMVGLSESEILSSDFQVKIFEHTAFISFHGWYDYSLMDGKLDLPKILAFKNSFYFDRKIHRSFDDVTVTQNILINLEKLLTELSATDNIERIIVSTHFVPHEQFIINTRYEKFARFNAYLGSRYFHEIFMKFPKVSDVVFGHLHHRMMPTQIDGITYHAKPLGYIYEWQMVEQFLQKFPEYTIPEFWHLRKRYNAIKNIPEWQAFKQEHLTDEFLSAMTIFEF